MVQHEIAAGQWQPRSVISAAQWQKVVRQVLDEPAKWTTKGKLTYRTPVDLILLGVHGEGSGMRPNEIYISVLTMPLFVPAENLTLSHAKRVPSGTSTFGLDDPKLSATLQSAVRQVPPQRVALETIASSRAEESAYAALLLGRHHRAEGQLAEPYAPGDAREFVEAARRRRSEVLQLLRSSGAEPAERLLRHWRDKTAAHLGVS